MTSEKCDVLLPDKRFFNSFSLMKKVIMSMAAVAVLFSVAACNNSSKKSGEAVEEAVENVADCCKEADECEKEGECCKDAADSLGQAAQEVVEAAAE